MATIAVNLSTEARTANLEANTQLAGIMASVLGYESFIRYFRLNSTTIGIINSVYQAASAVGALFNFYLPNKFGRKHSCISFHRQGV
jgi:MFS family permease